MSKGTNKGEITKVSAEMECWASGGVWMNGACVNFVKAAYLRGAGCDPGPTEEIIKRSLPGPVRQARERIIEAAIRQGK